MSRETKLLRVDGLSVSFPSRNGPVTPVHDVSFDLGQERLGIVGELGSGKSLTARALMGLLPAGARLNARRLQLGNRALRGLSPRQWQKVRGREIGLILQDPRYALHPVRSIGAQIVETLHLHHDLSHETAWTRAHALLESVHIQDAARVLDAYPHQISGGMGQRAMIALMLAAEPKVLIADEPTSALDLSVQNQVLAILDEQVVQRGMGLILISHDLDLVARFCDRILVMYRGRVVEEIAAKSLDDAQHPYTRGLLACVPRLDARRERLVTLDANTRWAGGVAA